MILGASVLIHLIAWMGTDLTRSVPRIMMWGVGATVLVCIVASVYAIRAKKVYEGELAEFMPRWLVRSLLVLFVYAVIHFIIFIVSTGGVSPDMEDGQYVLISRRKVVRVISEPEYHRRQAAMVRGVSGYWMLFSGVAVLLLTAEINRRRHVASSTDAASAPNLH